MQNTQYLTVYLSGTLDFPNTVERGEELAWVSKSITQQINDHAERGWEVFDMHWLSDRELMVTFYRLIDHESEDEDDDDDHA